MREAGGQVRAHDRRWPVLATALALRLRPDVLLSLLLLLPLLLSLLRRVRRVSPSVDRRPLKQQLRRSGKIKFPPLCAAASPAS